MTRRRDTAADRRPRAALLADSFAPVCTLVGKTWSLHLEKVVKVDREENLRMIAESVAFLVGRRARRVVYDAEHFFDGFARRPGLRAALPAGRGRGGRRLRDAVRHQRRVAARRGRGRDRARWWRSWAARQVGIHSPRRRRLRRGQLARGVRAGARMVQGTMNGYGERCGNANLVSIVPNLQLKLGYECLP